METSPVSPPSTTNESDTHGDEWAALDALAFDTSLSFLSDADARPVPAPLVPARPTSPALQSPTSQDHADRALEVSVVEEEEDPESEPFESTSRDGSSPRGGHGSDTSGSPPSPSPTPGSDPPPKRVYVSSRVRQKQEIAYLRDQVVELERELAARQAGAETVPSTWQSIAQRQLGEKKRAERENATLCSLLEGQLRVARSLEKLLRKRVLSETDALFVDRKRLRGATALDLEMAVVEIHARIAHQFSSVRTVMQECGLAAISSDHDDARASHDTASNGICMELMTVKVYPFSLNDVTDAVWACACGGGDSAQAELEFTVPLHVRRSEAQVHIRGVCERRADGVDALIVFENVGVVEGPLVAGQAINCREFGYIVVEEGEPTDVAPTTILKACARMWPEADVGVGSSGTPEVGLFVDLVLGFYNEHLQTVLQTVENVLLSRSAGK